MVPTKSPLTDWALTNAGKSRKQRAITPSQMLQEDLCILTSRQESRNRSDPPRTALKGGFPAEELTNSEQAGPRTKIVAPHPGERGVPRACNEPEPASAGPRPTEADGAGGRSYDCGKKRGPQQGGEGGGAGPRSGGARADGASGKASEPHIGPEFRAFHSWKNSRSNHYCRHLKRYPNRWRGMPDRGTAANRFQLIYRNCNISHAGKANGHWG